MSLMSSMRISGSWTLVLCSLGLLACGKGEPDNQGAQLPLAVDAAASDLGQVPKSGDTTHAPPEIAPIDADGASSEREKVLALAVASECMRRSGIPQAQASQTMLSLYRAHHIELETYTRVMTKLSADPTFTTEIERLTRDCPEMAAVSDVQVIDVADASPPDTEAPRPDAAKDTTPPPGDIAADTRPLRDAEPKDSRPLEDVKVPGDAGPVPQDIRQPPNDARDLSGPWMGALNGRTAGTLRVVVRGRDVVQAVATFGRKVYKLKGSISDAGAILLAGTEGNDFIRVNGTLEANRKAFSGNWNAVVGRDKINGRFRILR